MSMNNSADLVKSSNENAVNDQVHSIKEMQVTLTRIGEISHGIDGRDEYVLMTRIDDNVLTPDQAIDWMRPRVYCEGSHAGSYFCHTVLAVQSQYSTNSCICTVQHRYDV